MQTPEETLRARAAARAATRGWLLVQILRHLGLAARFASGYLIQLVADVKPLDGPAGPTAISPTCTPGPRSTCPGAGWIGLDPTSGLLAGEGHIPLACTADPGSAAPVIGFTDPCEVEFDVRDDGHAHARGSARHQALHRRAVGRRSTRSASRSIAISRAHDVRLTQGGEPTFVSIDDMEGAEWNYRGAGAEEARARRDAAAPAAGALRARRLAALSARASGIRASRCRAGRWASTGAATACRCGAIRALLADTRGHGRRRRRRRAALSPRALAVALGLAAATCHDRVRGRAATARRRSRAAGQRRSAAGAICRTRPSARASRACCSRVSIARPASCCRSRRRRRRGRRRAAALASSPWPLRREHLYPVAGDSPLGLRLPLASLPERAARGRGAEHADRPVRAARRSCRRERAAATAPAREAHRGAASRAKWSRPRCASRCATATCTSSCRRSTRSRTTSRCSPRSRTPRARSRRAGRDRRLCAAARSAPAACSPSRPIPA